MGILYGSSEYLAQEHLQCRRRGVKGGHKMKDIYRALWGYFKGYWGLMWAIYNISFVLFGRTPVWPKPRRILWS